MSERNKSYTFFICWPSVLAYPCFALHLILLSLEGLLLSSIKGDRKILEKIYLPCLRSLWKDRRSSAAGAQQRPGLPNGRHGTVLFGVHMGALQDEDVHPLWLTDYPSVKFSNLHRCISFLHCFWHQKAKTN